jgi:NADH-quinone oxidoreductase subunit L
VLAIMGFPFTSGFYSKDAIIAQVLAYGNVYPEHLVILSLPVLTAGITTFYMFRLWFLTFSGTPRDAHVYDHAHESPPVMWVPLAILAAGAVLAGGLPFWHVLENFISYGQPAAVGAGPFAEVQPLVHEMHTSATLVASAAAAIGFFLAAAVYWKQLLNPDDARRQFPGLYNLLANKWYFDELYRYLFVRPTLVLGSVLRWIDAKIIDGAVDGSARETVFTSRVSGRFDLGIVDGLVNLIADVIFGGGLSLRRVQTGWLRGYIMTIALGAVAVFALGAYLFRA